jgi:hypothetical protein
MKVRSLFDQVVQAQWLGGISVEPAQVVDVPPDVATQVEAGDIIIPPDHWEFVEGEQGVRSAVVTVEPNTSVPDSQGSNDNPQE